MDKHISSETCVNLRSLSCSAFSYPTNAPSVAGRRYNSRSRSAQHPILPLIRRAADTVSTVSCHQNTFLNPSASQAPTPTLGASDLPIHQEPSHNSRP
ncbi:hypothetical protein BD414DRAFT_320929 [Trametes punicea]|nr:hypothetical protein BD414DRAFT_320929 [Trametes punicea]